MRLKHVTALSALALTAALAGCQHDKGGKTASADTNVDEGVAQPVTNDQAAVTTSKDTEHSMLDDVKKPEHGATYGAEGGREVTDTADSNTKPATTTAQDQGEKKEGIIARTKDKVVGVFKHEKKDKDEKAQEAQNKAEEKTAEKTGETKGFFGRTKDKVVGVFKHDKGEKNETVGATGERCDKEVVAKSANAVGNPCATTEQVAQSLGLSQQQIDRLNEKSGLAH